MSLTIKKQNKTYYLSGSITQNSSELLISLIERKLEKKKKILLNIDEIKLIDLSGINSLKYLINLAIKKGRTFYITGNGCKEVYDDYFATQVA